MGREAIDINPFSERVRPRPRIRSRDRRQLFEPM